MEKFERTDPFYKETHTFREILMHRRGETPTKATLDIPEQRQPEIVEPQEGRTFRDLLVEFADWRVGRMQGQVNTRGELQSVGNIALSTSAQQPLPHIDK